MPRMIEGAGSHAQISDVKIQVAEVMPASPAEKAGLKIGDIILSINNQKFLQEDALQNYVDENSGQELAYQIKSAGEDKVIKITPEKRVETGRGGVGIAIVSTGIIKYPWHIAIWEGIKTSVLLVWAIIVAFYGLIKNIILGHGVGADVAGPVGIATMTGQAARMGWIYVLQFTALLSVNLAVINFLPLPALDGGRVLFIIFEKIKGRPVRREIEATMHYIGFALLLLLVAIITFRDVLKIWTR
jgi:regulator of sigma E protease